MRAALLCARSEDEVCVLEETLLDGYSVSSFRIHPGGTGDTVVLALQRKESRTVQQLKLRCCVSRAEKSGPSVVHQPGMGSQSNPPPPSPPLRRVGVRSQRSLAGRAGARMPGSKAASGPVPVA